MSTVPPSPQPTPSEPQSQLPSTDSRNLALLCHLLGIFTGFVGPLIIWLIKKDQDPFVDDQGKEALNFQITMVIATLCCLITLCIPPILVLLVLLMTIFRFIFCIIATVQSSQGKRYRYPICIRLVK